MVCVCHCACTFLAVQDLNSSKHLYGRFQHICMCIYICLAMQDGGDHCALIAGEKEPGK